MSTHGRDLKCENILLDGEHNVKVTDFGFSIMVSSAFTAKLSTHCGSYAYAAPEILAGRLYIGTQTDIWSLFVTLNRLSVEDSNQYFQRRDSVCNAEWQAAFS